MQKSNDKMIASAEKSVETLKSLESQPIATKLSRIAIIPIKDYIDNELRKSLGENKIKGKKALAIVIDEFGPIIKTLEEVDVAPRIKIGVKDVIFDERIKKTIVKFDNGDESLVKLIDGDKFDEYRAFCAAVAKYYLGSNSQIKKHIKSAKRIKPFLPDISTSFNNLKEIIGYGYNGRKAAVHLTNLLYALSAYDEAKDNLNKSYAEAKMFMNEINEGS